MRIRTATVALDAPRRRVFEYLSDPRNHPEWATEFIRHMEEHDGMFWADTQMGRVRYAVEADRGTGVIDILVSPEDGSPARFPARVVELERDGSAVAFTLAQPPGMPDDEFERSYASLERELHRSAAIYRDHPEWETPSAVADTVRRVLGSGEFDTLLDAGAGSAAR